jgi:hypothetical protein
MENEFVVPKSPGKKTKVRNVCKYKEHNWTGQYYDGWLFLDCLKCEARNIQHQLTKAQVAGLTMGSYNWNVNKLPIIVDRCGNKRTKNGSLAWGYLETQEYNKEYYEAVKTSGNFGKPF